MPFCKDCGTPYTEGAKFCPNCGANLQAPVAPTAQTSAAAPRKDSGVAALLAGLAGLVLFGIGHFYVGKIGRGVVLLVVGIVLKLAIPLLWFGSAMELTFTQAGPATGLLILFALLNLITWIWQIYDAYRLAKTYNAVVESTGKPPW
jgi:TM2 domain-containing membrane protein YozV